MNGDARAAAYARRMLSRLVLVTVAGVMLAQARGVPGPGIRPPLVLQLDGVIAPSAEAAHGQGFAVASLGFLGSDTRRWLAVTKARTTGGDQPLDGKDVLAEVAPFTPNLLVAGPGELVSRLRDAPMGSEVHVEGLVHLGSRTYDLRRVDRQADHTAG